MDQVTFAEELLKALNIPATPLNIADIVAWEKAENGGWNWSKYNPLNTTQKMPGSTSGNSLGVQIYTSWKQGIQATAKTLQNGLYGPILKALKSGGTYNFEAVVASTPWGTKSMPKPNPKGITVSSYGELLAALKTTFNTPYVYGAEKLNIGFDCSSLVQWAYKQIGINLPRVATDQAHAPNTFKVDRNKLKPGDLLFYQRPGGAEYDHVEIYIGNGKSIAARHSDTNVQVWDTDKSFTLAKRVKGLSEYSALNRKHVAGLQDTPDRDLNLDMGIGDALGVVRNLGEKDTWIRVLKVIAGFIAIGGGIVLMTREIGVAPPNPVQETVDMLPGPKKVVSGVTYLTKPKYVESVKVHGNVEGTSTITTREYKSKRKGTEQREEWRGRTRKPQQIHHQHEHKNTDPKPTFAKKFYGPRGDVIKEFEMEKNS